MPFLDLFTLTLLVALFQILHCFEEIGMNAYLLLEKRCPKNPRGAYLRVATVLVTLNFAVIFLLLYGAPFAPYLCIYTVYISLVNCFVHLYGWYKTKAYMGTLGAGVFSGIPLGIAGAALLYVLLTRYVL